MINRNRDDESLEVWEEGKMWSVGRKILLFLNRIRNSRFENTIREYSEIPD